MLGISGPAWLWLTRRLPLCTHMRGGGANERLTSRPAASFLKLSTYAFACLTSFVWSSHAKILNGMFPGCVKLKKKKNQRGFFQLKLKVNWKLRRDHFFFLFFPLFNFLLPHPPTPLLSCSSRTMAHPGICRRKIWVWKWHWKCSPLSASHNSYRGIITLPNVSYLQLFTVKWLKLITSTFIWR